ncbi:MULTISPECIES: type VI secretion system baseplate subunit TssK [Rhizobium]|uniref:Type VI secretion system baseplate subunit TssK n=2 Tax=Rhizobium TaxID=379 RepID=A0A9Q3QYL1_9HYPH|nr:MULTISPECIES: type VI secretion system baseplate subunit TssK [Rhizobium]MBX4956784.1 type VI secretion system baseplate subunit TssK [Rhizobium lentis]MBX4975567.1 type VI secretion system baseplate subunit TssK [Rhizobium lentis]MBX4986481.1 type VI secretion system baseplate subunit TssK [Rhizobium lentis]MBX4999262.1 type VI secretion system baseplate subunit TssK [Rhizobium lentis]MBX5004925.1 type VI secretion system baseplate subunit TssK [Rhizobium lentis]
MTDTNKVLWSEGLFLRTQHFQQQDRYTEALIRGALQAGRLQTFGFRSLTLDTAQLETGRVAVLSARGIFPDGTPFSIPETMDAPVPLTITRDMGAGAVQLALPLEPPGGASFDAAHSEPTGARYKGQIERVRDAVHGGADPEEIEIARAQALLLSPVQMTGGYTAMPVAKVNGLLADGSVAMGENFLPPALTTGAVAFYGQLMQEVITGLDRIADAHGKMVLGGAGRSVENLLVLDLANTARPRLAHMLPQEVFHPAELFLELSGLAGRMATYGSGSRRLTELPTYDHMAPGPAFAALADTLRSLLLSLRYVEPKSRALPVLKHATNVWKVRVDNPELLTASRIVVRVGCDMSEDALRKIFVDQVTVGAADEFEALWKSRLPGIRLKPLHSQPREIPYDGDRLCLELDQRSEHWESLLRSPGFVIGVSGVLPSEPQVDCYSVNR